MRRFRTSMIGFGAAAVLAATALTGPAALAIDGQAEFVVVHGLPGVKAEICVNGGEVKSKFLYGRKFIFEMLPSEFDKVVVRRKSAGQCKGKKLAKFKEEVKDFSSHTLVLIKKQGATRFQSFDNYVPDPGPSVAMPGSRVAVQHAAKGGAVDAYAAQTLRQISAAGPTFAGMRRGDFSVVHAEPGIISTWLTLAGKSKVILGPSNKEARFLTTNHHVVVGTNKGNYKLVFFRIVFPV